MANVLTPLAILSFPALVTPKPVNDEPGAKLKYQAKLIFPDGTDRSTLEAAVISAGETFFGKTVKVGIKDMSIADALEAGPMMGGLRTPFRIDGLNKGDPWANYVNAKSNNKPGCVWNYADAATGKAKVMTDAEIESALHGGAFVYAVLSPFGYNNAGNRGITFGLEAIQFVKDGPYLGKRTDAQAVFAPLDAAPTDVSHLL